MANGTGFLPVVAVFLVVLAIGRWIYMRNAGTANTITSTFGIFNGVVRILIGFIVMLGATPFHLAVGGVFVLWGVLGFSTHKDRLNESMSGSTLRSKLY